MLSVDRFPFGSHVSDDQQRAYVLFSRLTTLVLSNRDHEKAQEASLPTTLQRLELEGDVCIECDDSAPSLLPQLTSLRGCAPDQYSNHPFFERYASRLLDLELAPDGWSPTRTS